METDKKIEARRRKTLGELGEELGMTALVECGYGNVRNLNVDENNPRFADLYAEKGGERFVVSVKARNKYQADGVTLNPSYNIMGDYSKIAKASAKAEKEHDAKACWLVVQFTRSTYTIYFGLLEELNGRGAVPIKECEDGKVGKRLVKGRKHGLDFYFLTNKKK